MRSTSPQEVKLATERLTLLLFHPLRIVFNGFVLFSLLRSHQEYFITSSGENGETLHQPLTSWPSLAVEVTHSFLHFQPRGSTNQPRYHRPLSFPTNPFPQLVVLFRPVVSGPGRGRVLPLQEHQEPEGWTRVPVMAQGAKALEAPRAARGWIGGVAGGLGIVRVDRSCWVGMRAS